MKQCNVFLFIDIPEEWLEQQCSFVQWWHYVLRSFPVMLHEIMHHREQHQVECTVLSEVVVQKKHLYVIE